MPSKTALILYEKCRRPRAPAACASQPRPTGVKSWYRKSRVRTPVLGPSCCASRSDCVRACPQKAIKIVVA